MVLTGRCRDVQLQMQEAIEIWDELSEQPASDPWKVSPQAQHLELGEVVGLCHCDQLFRKALLIASFTGPILAQVDEPFRHDTAHSITEVQFYEPTGCPAEKHDYAILCELVRKDWSVDRRPQLGEV